MGRFDRRTVTKGVLASALFVASFGLPAFAGDEDIFSAQVAPNVVLMVDNSGSMNSIMYHSSFDPTNPWQTMKAGRGIPS